MSEQKYRDTFAISQSSLKDWKELPPQKWYDKWILKITKRRTSDALDFGSLLDTLCFTEKEFGRRFIISEVGKVSDNVKLIVTDVYNHILQLNANIKELNDAPAVEGKEKIMVPFKDVALTSNKDVVLKFCKEHAYYESKPEQGYNTIVDKGSDLFEFLKKVGKRIVITQEQYNLAVELKTILYNDPISAGFFTPKKGCHVFFQVQIFAEFEVDGVDGIDTLPLKGMLDIIHVNTKRKEVREVDLKFTNDVYQFNHPFNGPVKKFDYVGQHSFYNFLLPTWLKTFEGGKFADYSIQPPLNVVIDDDTKLPYIYKYNMNDLYIKQKGIEGTGINGWEDVVNDIAWHLGNNDWSRPKEHVKHGFMSIDIYKKK